MKLDDELRRALAAEDAPAGFESRVLVRVMEEETPTEPRLSTGGSQPRRWLAIAAAMVLIVSGAGGYYEHRMRVAEAERATREVRLALQIASEKLVAVQRHVREAAERH